MEEKRIEWHDSMVGSNGRKYLNDIFQWIKDEHYARKGCMLPDAEQWTLVHCSKSTTPQQENGKSSHRFNYSIFVRSDCDVLQVMTVECLCA